MSHLIMKNRKGFHHPQFQRPLLPMKLEMDILWRSGIGPVKLYEKL